MINGHACFLVSPLIQLCAEEKKYLKLKVSLASVASRRPFTFRSKMTLKKKTLTEKCRNFKNHSMHSCKQ